ncbi:arginine repressor [Agrilactobacillus composti DSM 18527 = JCM 14202]|uniref:Arginine repressor n=1 Tax=Agrilactobacillus composti DSM 18527 = JCM 14202 TaxID=1423734 RepID=X0PE02_9LACO|nr:arginine repressor [Agrilactobacillus composti]KRM35754.1 arginine repressor [Agrilactobacillus composti DSM 18527 = JCM 14202]GAF39614.1 arginine pathway regulatory protein ArgR [Agrilactobacillus composti DSM 18527 = JCM 14202]
MKKTERQMILEQIIHQHVVSTQDELLALLKDEGVDATQATISRDIRDLQIVKARDESGNLRYMIFQGDSVSNDERLEDTISNVVLSVVQVQFLNVVKTLPSNGNVLAAVIDDLSMPDVVGTVAGHDTVVIISPDNDAAKRMHQRISDNIIE